MKPLRTKVREEAKRLIPAEIIQSDACLRKPVKAMPFLLLDLRRPLLSLKRERKQWEREQAEADWQDEQAAKDDDEAEQPAEYETGLAADSIGARLLADVREQVETARLQGEALARSAIENRRASESQNQVVEYRPYAPAPTGLGIYLDTDIVDLWAAERSPAAKTKDSYKRVTEWRHERVGRKSVEQFTRKYILAFKGKPLAEGRTPQNVNVKLGNLRTLLNGPSITTMPKSILHLGSC